MTKRNRPGPTGAPGSTDTPSLPIEIPHQTSPAKYRDEHVRAELARALARYEATGTITPGPGERRCRACGRVIVSRRQARRAPGVAVHAGHGLCQAHYRREHYRPVASAGRARGGRPGKNEAAEVDDVKVWRAAAGERFTLSTRERECAVALLNPHCSSAETARRLGISQRSVQRIRRRLRDDADRRAA